MDDLISRQAAIQAILDMRDCYNGFSDTYDKAEIIGMLEEVPSAQPERKTGEWIYGEDGSGQDGWTCSECGFFVPWYYDYYGLNNIDFIRDFHTCPHCDAMMLTYTGKDGGGA